MFKRISCIVLVVVTRLAASVGRLVGQEANPGHVELVPMPTMGGKQFWADELFFHQWRIQRNVFTGHCRLLDGRDFRHAWGTYQECEAALDRIKRDRHLPTMHGKAVVVLHGLVRSHSSMDSLCRHLQKKGGYQVFNVEYPSTQQDIGEIARSLRHIINHLDGIEEINFVGHSMGNIVIRHYLGDLERKGGQAPFGEARLRAVRQTVPVRIGPLRPLRDARPAEPGRPAGRGVCRQQPVPANCRRRRPAAWRRLARSWKSGWPRRSSSSASSPAAENGPKGYNPMLKDDNDGVISVETAKLHGARDLAVVPVLHSFIMDDAKVQQYALRFIQHG